MKLDLRRTLFNPGAGALLESASERDFPREAADHNFKTGVVNGILYVIADTLIDPTLVLVAFLSTLTASPLMLGLLLPIRDGVWALPQLWVSGYLQSKPRKITVYRQLSLLRILLWAALVLTINFIRQPNIALIAFFTVYTTCSFINGLAGLPFFEVIAKTVPPERRGEFFALRMALGGLGSIGASMVVRWVVNPASPFPFPHNYGFLAFLFFIFASISVTIFSKAKEPFDSVILPSMPFGAQLKRALKIVRGNTFYRRYLLVQAAMLMGGAATPFFAIYVQQQLGGSKAMIGVYLAVFTASNLFSNATFGRVSRRFGSRKILVVSTLAGLLMTVLVMLLSLAAGPLHLSAAAAGYWLLPVFVLNGLRGSGYGVSVNSLMLDLAPADDRSIYIGLTNSLVGVVLLATGISGVIVKVFSFQTLFLFAIAAHILALLTVRRMDAATSNQAGSGGEVRRDPTAQTR